MSNLDIRRVLADCIDTVPSGTCIFLNGEGGIEIQTPGDPNFKPIDGTLVAVADTIEAIRQRDKKYKAEKKRLLNLSAEEFTFPPERLQHGDLQFPEPAQRRGDRKGEKDPDGYPVTHARSDSTIDRLFRNGHIDEEMAKAGRRFARHFYSAGIEGRVTSSYEFQSTRTGEVSDTAAERQAMAREMVNSAMRSLGGQNRPAGSALWFIIGVGNTIKEFAERQRFGHGGHMTLNAAQTTLKAALACLVGHYEDEEAERKRAEQFARREYV